MIDERDRAEAEILGKAMRFGAMLWMNRETDQTELRWYPKKKQLEFRLTEGVLPLYGEVAENRLKSLAASLGAEVAVKQVRRKAG
jgi:exopolyphosphatase/guanosine-5'-triphosphate,3'-diphosphate pyrophosphatase